MLHVNSIYKTKEINRFVDEVIYDLENKDFRSVSFSDLLYLSGLLVKAQKENNCSDWLEAFLTESVENAFVKNFTKQRPDYACILVSNLDAAVVTHFENVMEEIFNERMSEYEQTMRERRFEE